MGKNNNVLQKIIIFILCIIIAALLVIIYLITNSNTNNNTNDIDLPKQEEQIKTDDNNKKEGQIKTDDNNKEEDIAKVKELVASKLSKLPNAVGCLEKLTDNEVLDNQSRLLLTNRYLYKNSHDIITNYYDQNKATMEQATAYVSYEDFLNAYKLIYGDNYSLTEDLKNASPNYASYKETEGRVYFRSTYYCGSNITYAIDSVTYNESSKSFVAHGSYKDTSTDGTFNIEVTLKDNDVYIKSIKLISN